MRFIVFAGTHAFHLPGLDAFKVDRLTLRYFFKPRNGLVSADLPK